MLALRQTPSLTHFDLVGPEGWLRLMVSEIPASPGHAKPIKFGGRTIGRVIRARERGKGQRAASILFDFPPEWRITRGHSISATQ